MKKVTIKAADTKPENDRAKKLYRVALDIIRRLDEIVKQKKAFKDVFQPEAVSFRGRLQDYCERLMFYDPAEYGRKAEELLWRKVYYDVIQLMKHNKKQMKTCATVESAFKTHLCSATGYYHHLLFKLQCEYSLKLEGVVDVFHVPEPRNHKKSALWGKRVEPEPHVKEWAIKACHRCLVYLGDIARYRQEYDEQRSSVVAQRYYYQALYLCPQLGMPHNQLGTLAGTRCYNMNAIYHYLRCMVSPSSFEGAEGNLIRLFERNGKRYGELAFSSPRGEMPPDQRRSKDIKRFIVRFLHLCDVFVSQQQTIQYSPKDLQDLCQATLNDFNLCMFYQPTSWNDLSSSLSSSAGLLHNEEKPLYLDNELIFKVAVISMICIHIQRQMDNKQVVAATAFSLALFSHVLNHVVIRLQSALYELENPRKVIQLPSDDEKRTTSTDFDEEHERKKQTENGMDKENSSPHKENNNSQLSNEKDDQKRKRKTRKLKNRRRRRRGTDSSTDSDHSHVTSESDLSEGALVMSGSEAELSFLNHSDSSASDTDDQLMVSQEMRPGFSGAGSKSDESIQEDGTSLAHRDIDDALNDVHNTNGSIVSSASEANDSKEGIASDNGETLNDIKQSPTSNSMNSQPSIPVANNNSVKLHMTSIAQQLTPDLDKIADMSQYLQEFPVDWLSDSSNMFQQTLKFASLLNGEENAGQITEVAQGRKQVRVPPGFEQSEESIAVQEITDKITNFNIETDTEANINTDTETCVTTESELETETETDRESVIDRTEDEQLKLERLLSVVTGEGLLSTIKIYCDWMRCNPQVMVTCAKSSLSLWSRLSVLLNFLPPETDLCKTGLCDVDEVTEMLRGDKTSQPLSEDVHLRCFPPLAETHANLDYSPDVLAMHLDDKHEVMLRVYMLRQFGYFLSQMESIPLQYDKEKNLFLGPVQPQTQQDGSEADEKAAQQQMVDKQARRNQLMKDMAQLRLQAEVSELEGSLCQSAQRPSLPPYLVPDATVLCDTLNLLKQLAHCGIFIVIIPIAVIDHLDVLKKESAGAREAIRWLEAEFKKGNRYVRSQKQHEKTTKFPHKNMKKKDKDAWRYVQIIDCAKYLPLQSTEGESGHSMEVRADCRLCQVLVSAEHGGRERTQHGVCAHQPQTQQYRDLHSRQARALQRATRWCEHEKCKRFSFKLEGDYETKQQGLSVSTLRSRVNHFFGFHWFLKP